MRADETRLEGKYMTSTLTKIRVAAVTMFMILGTIVALTISAGPASATRCVGVHRYDTAHTNDGSTGDDEWWLKFSVHYTYCHAHGPDYVKGPYMVGVGYNQEGSHMSCSANSNAVLHYVGFNPYFWDGDGRNFNPGEIRVPCNSSTRNSATKFYDGERLYVFDGTSPPRAKVNWRLEKAGPFWQKSGSMSVVLRGCSGKGSSTC
jgi:hypothetical protein